MVWIGLVALWAQLWWALVPTWRDGEFYAYGWFVPPLVLLLGWQRWRDEPVVCRGERVGWREGIAVGALLAGVMVLRAAELAEPLWRFPLLAHALLVAAATVIGLGRWYGWQVARRMAPLVVLALSAVPPSSQLERAMVEELTGTVINITREIYLLQGQPVEVVGERLVMGDVVVEVTQGCSGMRSLQSLFMVALFFGELLRLPWPRRVALVAAGCVAAVAANTGRALVLVDWHLARGVGAAQAAHDQIGNVAFLVSAMALFLSAWMVRPRPRGRVVRRTLHVAQPTVPDHED